MIVGCPGGKCCWPGCWSLFGIFRVKDITECGSLACLDGRYEGSTGFVIDFKALSASLAGCSMGNLRRHESLERRADAVMWCGGQAHQVAVSRHDGVVVERGNELTCRGMLKMLDVIQDGGIRLDGVGVHANPC